MNTFFDIERILNKDYPIEEENLTELLNKYKSDPTFQNKLNLAWNTASNIYAEKLKPVFDFTNNSLKEQVSTELLLQLCNVLSTATSEYLFGAEAFLDNTQFLSQTKQLTYKGRKTFNSFVKHLQSLQPERLNSTLIKSIPGEPLDTLLIKQTTRSDLIIEDTPLYDFIFTHLIYKNDDFQDEFPLSESDTNNKIKYCFLKEGRYFLSVILLASASKNIPYTTKAINGISLNSINNLFDTLYYAYHQEELTNNPEESFLFFINTECLFQCSFLTKVFSTLSDCFHHSKDIALWNYILSLVSASSLITYPLNVAKITIWDYFYKEAFKLIENINTTKNSNANENSNTNEDSINFYPWFTSIMNNINDMSDCFIYILLFNTFFSIDNPKFMTLQTLKKEILTYLSKNGKPHMQWSFLASSSKNYLKIPTVFNEYLDFYLLYEFYNKPYNSMTQNWTQKDLAYYSTWSGYNLYLKYVLEHKK